MLNSKNRRYRKRLAALPAPEIVAAKYGLTAETVQQLRLLLKPDLTQAEFENLPLPLVIGRIPDIKQHFPHEAIPQGRCLADFTKEKNGLTGGFSFYAPFHYPNKHANAYILDISKVIDELMTDLFGTKQFLLEFQRNYVDPEDNQRQTAFWHKDGALLRIFRWHRPRKILIIAADRDPTLFSKPDTERHIRLWKRFFADGGYTLDTVPAAQRVEPPAGTMILYTDQHLHASRPSEGGVRSFARAETMIPA